MKRKIAVRVESRIIRLAKRKAAEEGRSFDDLVHDALALYLTIQVREWARRP